MKESHGLKISKGKRISITTMRNICSEIYKKRYVIKSLSYVAKLTGGFKTVLNCECKKHKICFSTTKSEFLNTNEEENRVSCSFCREDKHKEKFSIEHYQKMIDKYKGKNVALFLSKKGNKFNIKCLKHDIDYSQSGPGLNRCGCIKCFENKLLSNSRITLAQINDDINKWGDSLVALQILGNYNTKTGEVRNVLYKCTKSGHEGDIIKPIRTRLSSNPCSKCVIEKKSLDYNQMVERALIIHPVGYTYSKTRDIYTIKNEIHFKCPTCSSDNIMSFKSHFYKKRGCTNCIRKTNGKKSIISDEDILTELKNIGKDWFHITGNRKSDSSKKNLMRQIVCKRHNESFYTCITKSYLKYIGCKFCNCKSKMEQYIEGYLKFKNIEFEKQKRFKDCLSIGQLPFDFYIPDVPSTNRDLLIEYDGEQHFLPIYGEEIFKEQVKRDAIKTAYAESIGVELIRIPYTRDKDIIQILDEKLFN